MRRYLSPLPCTWTELAMWSPSITSARRKRHVSRRRIPVSNNNFDDLHATQLPIAHPAHLVVADMVMNRAAGGLILREDHPGLMLRDETCPHWPNRHDERHSDRHLRDHLRLV